MPRNEAMVVIRDFLGINRRDGAERASDREFLTIQNFFRKEKGVLYKRYGSSYDLTAAQVPGCDRITAIHRHAVVPCPKAVLYHCTPTSTPITHPGATGLTISEVVSASGTIFDAAPAASRVVHFCYSYIGMGVESSWDTRARPLYVPWTGAPINAWDQLGLQTWVLAAATNKLQVSHPTAFPSDVRAVNVFMSIGDPTDGANRRQLVYVGTLNSNSDVLDVDVSIAPSAADADTYTDANLQVEARQDAAGEIKPGQYYISIAWVINGEPQDELNQFLKRVVLSASKVVSVTANQNAIGVHYWEAAGTSANGATHAYVFFGPKDSKEGPMTCVGSFRIGTTSKASGLIDTFVLKKIPYNRNAVSQPGSSVASFANIPHQLNSTIGIRHAFIVKKDPDRPQTISEVFPARSGWLITAPTNTSDFFYFLIRSPQDMALNNSAAFQSQDVIVPSFAYFSGLSYFANGHDFLVTDGIGIARMAEKSGSVIPARPRFIFTFKNQLVCSTSDDKGVIFGSNALQANNWSDGGTGADYRFAILGDAFESRIVAAAQFSYTTGTEGPRSFLVIFKKNSCWSLTNIPDATSGVNAQADQLSGRVGTMAPKSIVQTKLGLMFLGSDGDIYLIRGSGEPVPIGGKVKPLLAHLAGNETLMGLCNASYHEDFWKLSYPSSASSTYCNAQIWADLRTEDGAGIQWDGPHVGVNIGCQLVKIADGDDFTRIAGIANAAGSVLLDDPSTYQDLGSPIVSKIEWTLRRFVSEFNFKKYRGLFVEAFYDTTIAQSVLVEGESDAEYTQKNHILSPGDSISGEARWRRDLIYFSDDNLIGGDFKFKLTHEANAQYTLAAVGIPTKQEKRYSG